MALCSHASSSCDAPCQVYMESWLLKTLNEKLVALPFECALQTAQFVMTLGEPRYLRPIPSLSCVPSPSRRMMLSCGLAVRTGAEGVREAPLPSHAALTIALTLTLSRFAALPTDQVPSAPTTWQFVQFITNFVIELVIMVVKRIGLLLRRRNARC